MAIRAHRHSEVFSVAPERLFEILYKPSAIRAWWGASRVIILPRAGGFWAATWGDDEDEPEYISAAKIATFEPPHRMVLAEYQYLSRSGPLPFETQFVTSFTVTPHEAGGELTVVQEGFPEGSAGDEFYTACEQGWRDTFAGIRRYLATCDGET